MENKDVLKLIYIISEIFYKNGKYGLERISLICRMIKQVFNANKSGLFNTLKKIHELSDSDIKDILNGVYGDLYTVFKTNQSERIVPDKIRELLYYIIELIKNFSPKDIAHAIQQLVDNDSKASNLIPTDDFSIKIMQAFAKKMNSGYYIDPCVGSGRLLSGLDAKSLIGYDINAYCKDIAETYLGLAEWEEYKDRFSLYISTENFLYLDLRLNNSFVGRTFIFDPPLNDQLELYGEMHQKLSANNIYSANNNIPSEYAFLSKILFSVPDKENTSFICVFANNFLSAQDKFKMTFRRYLMNNSLIAVIQSNFSENNKIQKLILVGKNRLDNPHNSLRYFITPKDKNISEDDISKIVQKCLNNETFDEKEFYNIAKIKAYTLQEIRENDYQISMPQYFENEINPNEIKSLSEIVDDLKTSNQNLINTSNNLETLTSNLLDGIKNIQKSDLELSDIPPKAEGNLWFAEEDSDVAKAIRSFKNKEEGWTKIEIKLNLDNLTNEIENIKILYKENRLRIKNNYFEINTRKNIKSQNRKSLFETLMITTEQDNYWKNITKYLAPRQIKIFEEFIKFYFEDLKGDKKYFTDFTTSEIHSTIGTLRALGLLKYRADIDDIYERYFPYVGLLNIEEDF
ncbi:MAG TPA: hypothetical protein H9673_05815 [Candidatus Adamsella sp.]|nr:hypothetical protein [Candidatus Adamsella sp.]